MLDKNKKIFIAGHTGLLGRALEQRFMQLEFRNVVTKSHQELDLTQQAEVERFFKEEKPEYVVLAAAKVGGIQANISFPAQFIYENILIQSNVIHSSYQYGVEKLLFFGSACSYPRQCPQPMKEEYLLSGCLEPTNEPYAVAKIAGIKMCQAYNRQYGTKFICGIPSNIYGPHDHFGSKDSHVVPSLIDKFHQAKVKKINSVTIWGTGNPRREFIFSGDVADSVIFLMNRYNDSSAINIGSGEDASIKELAMIIKDVVGYEGELLFDTSKSDGSPQKLLDSSKIKGLGWLSNTSLQEGIRYSYSWYQNWVKLLKEKRKVVGQEL